MRQLPIVVACLLGCSSHQSVPGDASVLTVDATIPVDGSVDAILGASWQKLAGAPTIAGKQDDIFFLDAQVGWSVNGLGRIYHTTDGGMTWEKQLDQPGTYFRAISFLDAQHGFASNIGPDYYPGVTDTNPLYRTSDGGSSWQPITSFTGPTPKGICNFNRIDATHIVASGRVGGPSFFASSKDGGASWTTTELTSQIPMLVDAYFSSAEDGFVTGGSSTQSDSVCTILHTADGGATWQTAFMSQASGEMCWKLSFPSSKVGYASVLPFSGGQSSFIKTTDGGATWQELPFLDDTYSGLGIGFIDESIGWIGGEAKSKPAYRTHDGGQSWEADMSLGPYINRFRFVDAHTAYAIGQSIYKLEIP